MSLVSKLRQKLSDDGPCPERHDIQITDEETGSATILAIQQRDGLSSLVWELSAKRTAPISQDLQQWAERLAGRVTCLLEPLAVLEIDSLRNQALLRSASAGEDKDAATYFEVILGGATSAQVRRYQAARVADEHGRMPRREQIAFALTHEGLLKLVGDLTAA